MSYHIYVPIYLICGCALAIYYITKRDALGNIVKTAKQNNYSKSEHTFFIVGFMVLTIALWPISLIADRLEKKEQ